MDTVKLKAADVSILICTRDRRPMLVNLLADLAKQDYPEQKIEIIVVEETDTPRSIDGVNYVSIAVQNKGIGYARNIAWKQARNSILVYIDDDCRIGSNWLSCLLEPFQDEKVVAVQGGVSAFSSDNAIGWAESILGFPGGGIKRIIETEDAIRVSKEISTLNCAYREWVVEKVGGFDESLVYGGEDYLMAKLVAAFGQCLFIPKAMVCHKARGNLGKIWTWFVRRGLAEIGVVRTKKYLPSNYFSVAKASLTLKLTLFLVLAIVTSSSPLLVLPAILILYGILQYVRYFRIWQKSSTDVSSLLFLPVVKLTMDLAMDVGRIKALINE